MKVREIPYNHSMELKDIVSTRLTELGIGHVTAAKRSGLKENFIGDILKGRKQSVQLRNLNRLAEALLLDPVAMSRGELVRTDRSAKAPQTKPSITKVLSDAPTISIRGQVTGLFTEETSQDDTEKVGAIPIIPSALMTISEVYALYVSGRSMEPQFFPGDLIFVNPARPARLGDCVVIVISHGPGSRRVLGVFDGENSETVTLRRHLAEGNAPLTTEIPKARITARHKVMTTNEIFGA
ncbi:S24 family peptidase [Martelella endophytica]|uniref:Peptidase S24/S26A/S26B/S26C domain-containing protein n=1 Tax=Martelella endophytica TaxID=1486262 RepID=A0A0D5LS18_MAREN|nr:S24 family peptidase [Martelella endophytica]AJY46984.1 hypothetical protein TM49_16925 [Martelella endophytica]